MIDYRRDPDAPLPAAPEPWSSSTMPSRRDGPPFHMTEMIEAEPALAERILARLSGPASGAAGLATAIRAAVERGRPIVVTGCGTSEHAAFAVAEILREAARAAGLPSLVGQGGVPVAIQAFEGALEERLGGDGGLVIGISHEGGTWATNLALERARKAGAKVALITVSDRSPGAELADLVVTTEEQDQSWCHTVGYLSPIVAGLAVAGHLRAAPVPVVAIRSILGAGLAASLVAAAESLARAFGAVRQLVAIGGGADRVAARELVLKVEEGTHLPASMRDLETLLHGHLAGVDAVTGLVLVLADPGHAGARAARAASVLRAAAAIGLPAGAILGARFDPVLDAELTSAGRLVVPDTPGLPPVAGALLATAIPLQLLTERLARVRGVNPDPIRRDESPYLRAAEAAG